MMVEAFELEGTTIQESMLRKNFDPGVTFVASEEEMNFGRQNALQDALQGCR